MLENPFEAVLLTFAAALGWLRLVDWLAARGWIATTLSRKIIHIGTGPIFVLCWLLFPDQPLSRWLAALVPLLITAQFALVGLGVLRDDAAVQAMARSGDRRELLRGPLYYGAMFIVLTLLFWKTRPAGLTALLIMSGGDGLADVVGRRVASPALPWSPRKSLAGSLAVWLGGWLLAGAVLAVYARLEVFSLPGNWFWRLGWIGLLAAVVESLPFRDVDNLTVTLATLLAGLRWL